MYKFEEVFRMENRSLVQRRKERLVHITYFTVFITIYVLFIKYALAITAPFLAAFVIAMLLQRPINFLSNKMHGKGKKPLSFIFVSLIIILLAGVLVLLGYLISSEISDFVKFVVAKGKEIPGYIYGLKDTFDNLVSKLPVKAEIAVRNVVDGIVEKYADIISAESASAESSAALNKTGSTVISILKVPLLGIWSTAKQIPAVFTAIIIGMISCFFLTADYDGFVSMIKNTLTKEGGDNLSRAKNVIINVFGKWLKSYVMILFITFCEMALGLLILKWTGIYVTDYIFVIALCTSIVDIFPVFGTGTVLIPWAVYQFCTHNTATGIALLIIYGVITFVRQIIEPKLVSANVNMNPVITLMAMYIGLQVFGPLGILILPLTCIFIITLNKEGIIHLWNNKVPDEVPAEAPNPVENPPQDEKRENEALPTENTED